MDGAEQFFVNKERKICFNNFLPIKIYLDKKEYD